MGITLGKENNSVKVPPTPEKEVRYISNGISQDTEMSKAEYDFDLIVIGGGSGGLAAAKEAARFGKKVAVCDFVKPSPAGTSWGLGGTCVNVGCIPKKLMHQAALLGQAIDDASTFGWEEVDGKKYHSWEIMVEAIQHHIMSLNWGFKTTLQQDDIEYFNAYASFEDPHTLTIIDKDDEVSVVTSEDFIIAVGGRPKYPEIPGAEYCISSDDLFSLPHPPGKTLIVGASYVALECAGFLVGLGFDVTVLVRSVLLRGFDQQMASQVGEVLDNHGVKLLYGYTPLSISKVDNVLLVSSIHNENDSDTFEDVFDTVMFAIGRTASTHDLQLEKAGVFINESNGKILTNELEQSISTSHIYAIGDVAEGRPELTPAAIEAGVRLARRLYDGASYIIDYKLVPTTVFTPFEYSCVGYSEEDAIEAYGMDDIEVYHITKQPLEFVIPARDKFTCYSKLICLKSDNELVIGFHYLGPNAGEIAQGFALAMRLKATKEDFNNVIGIHPTCAEMFTTMKVTKASGEDWKKTSC